MLLRVEISSGRKNSFHYITRPTDDNGRVIASSEEISDEIARTVREFPMDCAAPADQLYIWVDLMFPKDIELALQALELYGEADYRDGFNEELEAASATVSSLTEEPGLRIAVDTSNQAKPVLEATRYGLQDVEDLWLSGSWHDILRALKNVLITSEVSTMPGAGFPLYAKSRAYHQLGQIRIALEFMNRAAQFASDVSAYRAFILSLKTELGKLEEARATAFDVLSGTERDPGLIITAAETLLKSLYPLRGHRDDYRFIDTISVAANALEKALEPGMNQAPDEIRALGYLYLAECYRLLRNKSQVVRSVKEARNIRGFDSQFEKVASMLEKPNGSGSRITSSLHDLTARLRERQSLSGFAAAY